jgi:site-specific recombinase XerD
MAATATVTELKPRTRTGRQKRRPVTVGEAIEQFLASPRCNESANTQRAYASVLYRVGDRLDPERDLAKVDDDEIGTTVTTLWGNSAPTTFNRNRVAVGSWLTWCSTKAKWDAPSLPGTCERRKEPADHTRVVSRPKIDRMCSRRDVPLREKLLWRMLYETASRATAVLQLNAEDLDFDNRCAPVTVKGGDTEWIVWGRGTALLLPRYLRGRESGPLFRSERRPGRIRLGYDRARTLIKHYTGLELHQLRHSGATHLGEKGADATVIRAKTHHKSLRGLGRYTKPGLAAVTTATELLDPSRRRS